MEVLLRDDVEGVGKKGEILTVSDGFARNFLIPKGRAIKASRGVHAQAEAMRRSRDVKDAREREGAEGIARALVAKVIRIEARAGAEGRLFGSVTAADVADAVTAQTGVELDRRKVRIDDPIRTLGSHEVPVRLHADVEFRLNVEVVAGS